MKRVIISLSVSLACFAASAQGTLPELSNDARSMGMGGAAVALSPSAMSVFNNIAAIGLASGTGAVSFGYSPWMLDNAAGNNIYSAGAFFRLADRHSVALGTRYFNMRNIDMTDLTDGSGNPLAPFTAKPWEMTVEAGYAYAIGRTMAVGVSVMFFHSDLGADWAEKSNSFGFDMGYYFNKEGVSAALVVSNIGTRLDWGGSTKSDMPAYIKGGGSYTMHLGRAHSLSGTLQLDYKFLDPQNNTGLEPGVGVEYGYDNLIFLRAGYRYADITRGFNYFSAGLGVSLKRVIFDFSMLFGNDRCPWNKTMLFSLGVKF